MYHLERADSRHNFSVHFLSIYLENGTTDRVFTFIPQLVSILALTFNLFQDLPLCMLTLTMTFVTFNKVITAQWPFWYVYISTLGLTVRSDTIQVRRSVLYSCGSLLRHIGYIGAINWSSRVKATSQSFGSQVSCSLSLYRFDRL